MTDPIRIQTVNKLVSFLNIMFLLQKIQIKIIDYYLQVQGSLSIPAQDISFRIDATSFESLKITPFSTSEKPKFLDTYNLYIPDSPPSCQEKLVDFYK
jgi:hypothetical protein